MVLLRKSWAFVRTIMYLSHSTKLTVAEGAEQEATSALEWVGCDELRRDLCGWPYRAALFAARSRAQGDP